MENLKRRLYDALAAGFFLREQQGPLDKLDITLYIDRESDPGSYEYAEGLLRMPRTIPSELKLEAGYINLFAEPYGEDRVDLCFTNEQIHLVVNVRLLGKVSEFFKQKFAGDMRMYHAPEEV